MNTPFLQQAHIFPSVLDRLLMPMTAELGASRPDNVGFTIAAIARDLGALFNCRRVESEVPQEFEEVSTSIVNFGVPDFATYTLRLTAEQNRLRKELETAIRRFEPRLRNATVVVNGWDEISPVLRFQVNATLNVAATSEPVMFETSFQSDNGKFAVKGQRR
jgi:type VI secretion system protein ImpF